MEVFFLDFLFISSMVSEKLSNSDVYRSRGVLIECENCLSFKEVCCIMFLFFNIFDLYGLLLEINILIFN